MLDSLAMTDQQFLPQYDGSQIAVLPDEVGPCQTQIWPIDEGLSLVASDYCPKRDLVIETLAQDATLTLTLAFEGVSAYLRPRHTPLIFRAGHMTMTCFDQVQGQRRYRAGERVRQLRLVAQTCWLKRYGLDVVIAAPGEVQSVQQGLISPYLQEACDQLMRSAPSWPLERHRLALELLSHHLRPLTSVPTVDRSLHARLLKARKLMQSRLDQPLNMVALGAEVGLSEHQMKVGFRQCFGTSPYRLLTQMRMQQAYAWLWSGEPVSTTAYRCGYQHPTNFSQAFHRYFGCAPTHVRESSSSSCFQR